MIAEGPAAKTSTNPRPFQQEDTLEGIGGGWGRINGHTQRMRGVIDATTRFEAFVALNSLQGTYRCILHLHTRLGINYAWYPYK